jgi:hypothetical protein
MVVMVTGETNSSRIHPLWSVPEYKSFGKLLAKTSCKFVWSPVRLVGGLRVLCSGSYRNIKMKTRYITSELLGDPKFIQNFESFEGPYATVARMGGSRVLDPSHPPLA